MQPAKRGRIAFRNRFDHFADKMQFLSNAILVRHRLDLLGLFLAQGTSRVIRQKITDFVEFQKFKRMCVHGRLQIQVIHIQTEPVLSAEVRNRERFVGSTIGKARPDFV
uniref:hypothetical protein n=1 Tax=Tuwongella immobilis TaxID=692036 RepID=UPI001E2A0E59|nr:hypothetical protein [Tuwongella immobilis]